jgi:hypothetical protein
MFVLPMAKPSGGFTTLLLQWQLPVAMVTGLADFKAAGPNATPHLTLTHYEELAGSKGLVLVAADVIAEGQLSVPEVRRCGALGKGGWGVLGAWREGVTAGVQDGVGVCGGCSNSRHALP